MHGRNAISVVGTSTPIPRGEAVLVKQAKGDKVTPPGTVVATRTPGGRFRSGH